MNKSICVRKRRGKENETKVYQWAACRYDGGFAPCGTAGTGKGIDRKSTRLNSSHIEESRMPSSA